LHRIQAAIDTNLIMVVADMAAVFSQHSNLGGDRLIIGRHGSTIATGSQIFSGIETKTTNMSNTAYFCPLPASSNRLGTVFNHSQMVVVS